MTLNIRNFARSLATMTLVVCALAAGQCRAAAADDTSSSADKQRQLIGVLQSEAPPQDKAIACKRLAIYGTKDAVPALAPLLADASLASWARTALEAIPGPEANAALREALGKVQGRLLIGTINSIGNRRDPEAIAGLILKLQDADAGVACAAGVALGRIGGETAAAALVKSLAGAPAEVRGGIAEGCVRCAEQYLAGGKTADAMKLYDLVRAASVPKQRILDATRGAILARGSDGLPLLLEQLRSPDKAMLSIGLSTARELPGKEITQALNAEVRRSAPDRQVLVFLALADRNDAAVMPAVLDAAKSGSSQLRIAAVGALDRSGNVSCVPVLLEAAVENNAELALAAKTAIARLPDKAVDVDLIARLQASKGKLRQVLVELAGLRRIEAAMPILLQCVEDADAGVRVAAVKAIGVVGDDKQTDDLVQFLQKTQNNKERAEIEKALLAISGRCGAACVPHLLPLAKNGQSALRIVALHALASVGGAEPLAAVKTACEDKDTEVQDEAIRTLSTWPNNWPDDAGVAEPLLALAQDGKNTAHQVLGLRGYLQYIQSDKKLNDDEKVAKINDLLPLMKRTEEKKLAIADLGNIPTGKSLAMLLSFTKDEALAEDACASMVNLLGKKTPGISQEERQKALQTALELSKDETLKRKARRLQR